MSVSPTHLLNQEIDVVGWKAAGTNTWSNKSLGEVFFGPLHVGELTSETTLVAPRHMLGIEPEVAIRLGRNGAPDAWALGFDIPASPLPEMQRSSIHTLKENRAFVGSLVLGPTRRLSTLEHSLKQSIVSVGETTMAARSLDQNLICGPIELCQMFLEQQARKATTEYEGKWVFTGGLLPLANPNQDGDFRLLVCGEEQLAIQLLHT